MQLKLRFILLCAWHAGGVQDTKCFIKRLFRWSIVPLSFHNMKQLHFIPLWSIRSAHIMRKWKMRVGVIFCQSMRGIRIKSPQILRCKRSVRPPPEKENHLKHTAVLCPLALKRKMPEGSSLSALNDAIQIHCSISMWTQNIQIHNDFHFFIKIIVCFCSFICPVRIP